MEQKPITEVMVLRMKKKKKKKKKTIILH